MAKAIDYLLDSKGNMLFTSGDLAVGYSDLQHIADTVSAFPGWWKQNPTDGIGIGAYLKARFTPLSLINKTRQQLEADGYTVVNPIAKMEGGELLFNPNSLRL